MGNKADCTGGPIFNICIAVTRSEQHMGNTNGPMVGSIFNICTASYVPWSDIRVTKLIPWGVDIQHLYCFLYALEHHMDHKADPMGRSILNIGIVFYTRWINIWVTKLTLWEGRYSICIAFYTH